MSITYCPCGHEEDNDQHACPVTHKRLRGTLSLAEEGLANYAQENGKLKAALERIGHYGDEENEWDAVERYSLVRTWAMEALGEFPDGSPAPQTAEHS